MRRMRTAAETLGQFIRRVREAKGLTLRLASDRAGISPAFLSDVELDRRTFSPKTLLPLAKALGLHADDLSKKLNEKRIADHQMAIDALRKGS